MSPSKPNSEKVSHQSQLAKVRVKSEERTQTYLQKGTRECREVIKDNAQSLGNTLAVKVGRVERSSVHSEGSSA